MDNKKVLDVYKIVLDLSKRTMPARTAFKFYRLKNTLAPYFNFYCEEEQKIIQKYKGKPVENKGWKFDNDDLVNVQKEMRDVATMQIEINEVPIEMSIDEIAQFELTPADIESLSYFITFIDGTVELR